MAAKEWASLLAGLALAGAGLAALASSGGEAPPPSVTAVTAPPATPAVTVPGPAPATVLPEAVEAVLAGNGPLELIDPRAFGIPSEVARVLAERGIVLTVTAQPAAAPLDGQGR